MPPLSTPPLSVPADVSPVVQQRYEDGYALHKSLIESVPESDFELINLDVMNVVTTVTGACHNIDGLRERIARLPEFDMARLERLPTLAYALAFTHSRFIGAATPVGPVTGLATKVAHYRDLFVHGIEALQQRDLMPENAMKEFVGGKGYKVSAVETVAAAHMLRQLPPAVFALTGVTAEEIKLGTSLAGELTEELGRRELVPTAVTVVTRERQAVYTLVIRGYDQARRAASFLRWNEGDADEFAPSLYAGRARRPDQSDREPVIAVVPVTPSAPSAPSTPAVPALDPRSPGMDPFRS